MRKKKQSVSYEPKKKLPAKAAHAGVTEIEYTAFQHAFDFFNAELFDGELPQPLISFTRRARMKGHFAQKRFNARADSQTTADEISLNPDTFTDQRDVEILSTLVHEMVHQWQYAFGKPSRSGYHNRQSADRMKTVGLQPTDNGAAGGRETGHRVTHYIIPGGLYAEAYVRLATSGFKLNWQSAAQAGKPRPESKLKFTCPECGLNAWAKPTALLHCGNCSEDGVAMEESGLNGATTPATGITVRVSHLD